jgi:hypothetical protein
MNKEMSSIVQQKSAIGVVGKISLNGDVPFFDTRVPYNAEAIVASLVTKLIYKGVLSHEEASEIFNSGRSYLH